MELKNELPTNRRTGILRKEIKEEEGKNKMEKRRMAEENCGMEGKQIWKERRWIGSLNACSYTEVRERWRG